MKFLLLFAFFQIDSLPPDSILFAALQQSYELQSQAQLQEYQESQQKEWLKYLPTVGLTYTLDGHPRPNISWSSNLLYMSQKNRQKREAKQISILQNNQLEYQKQLLELKALLQQHHFLQEDIHFQKSLLEYDRQLYAVKQDKAKHLEITPSELLKATKALKEKEYQITRAKRALSQLEADIRIKAHFLPEYTPSLIPSTTK